MTYSERPASTNVLAIVSLVLGVFGFGGCCCGGSVVGFLFGIPAIVTGWMARKQILESQQGQQGMQLATVGLAIGIIEVIASVLLLILFGSLVGISVLTSRFQQ